MKPTDSVDIVLEVKNPPILPMRNETVRRQSVRAKPEENKPAEADVTPNKMKPH